MRLGIVGGRLQGTEAVYLADEAGYVPVLVDRRPGTPASGLAAESYVFDVVADPGRTRAVFGSCDAVLPACEDPETLRFLDGRLRRWGVPLLFHLPSYETSRSKVRSDRLITMLDLPRPRPWPDCGLPAVVKPSESSGSEAVSVVWSEEELRAAVAALERNGHTPVVQEFVAGPSLSLEVVATRGKVFPLLPTGLEFDLGYDCRRVTAPAEAAPAVLAALDEAGRRLAHGLGLEGLMDVEVMLRGLEPKVIEIDARLPSQTPTAVYHCCGVNMVQVLVELMVEGREPQPDLTPRAGVVYQHVRVADGAIEVVGEHVMTEARPLARRPGFFGASDALTDHVDGAAEWVATLIFRGSDLPAARSAAAGTVSAIAAAFGLERREELRPAQSMPTAGGPPGGARTVRTPSRP